MNAHGPFDPMPATPVPPAGVGADQALAGLRVSGPGTRGGLDRFRLGPAAAGALRAALDCLTGDDAGAALQVMADESALEVRLTRVDPDGLLAAGGVLETVEGNLAPTPGVAGSWSVRLPILSGRETFLMIERGGLAIALPWHAVSRVRMMPGEGLAATAAREGVPVVTPLELASEPAIESPAVLVGLGLRRAYLLADRLVWRMTAEPLEAPPTAPDRRLGPALRAGDDQVFWMLDPAELLREVPMPPLPHVAAGLARALDAVLPAPPTARREPAAPASQAAAPTPAAPASEAGPPTRPRLRLIELTPSDVDPFGDDDDLASEWGEPEVMLDPAPDLATPTETEPVQTPPATPASLAPAASATPLAPVTPAAAPATPTPRAALGGSASRAPTAPRALVAEDSITACIFLERLLEQRGFSVRTVGSALDLRAALAAERWDLVLADVDLPDAHGARWLQGLAPRRADGSPAELVALVRDDEDAALAGSAGVSRSLRKPFEGVELEHLLVALGLPASPRRD